MVKYIYLDDATWFGVGYYVIPWAPPVSAIPWPPVYDPIVRYHSIRWPLPRHRVYEDILIGDTHYVLLRASEFQPAREGEQPNAV